MNKIVEKLVFANALAFIAQNMYERASLKYFALWPIGDYHYPGIPGRVGFEAWQLVTAAFMHGGISHILLNMYGLWAFGRVVEGAIGSRRFLSLYFASVLASGVVQLIYSTATVDSGAVPTIGASGGVFGVLLAFGMLFPHTRVMLIFPPIPMKAWFMVIAYGTIELVSGVTGTMQGVAHFAHLGGMLGALVMMLSWRGRPPPAAPDAPGPA